MAKQDAPTPPAPPTGQLPPRPTPVSPGHVTVYQKSTGKPQSFAYAIDAKEAVASGEYQYEPISAKDREAAEVAAREAGATKEAATLAALVPYPPAPTQSTATADTFSPSTPVSPATPTAPIDAPRAAHKGGRPPKKTP